MEWLKKLMGSKKGNSCCEVQIREEKEEPSEVESNKNCCKEKK
ncbi:hypothetical protein [Halobacillus trueperi]|nr:hypothetical protein [Halobacillus trueperi]